MATGRVGSASSAALVVANISDVTASAAEINTLDGITASTAELNTLDGVTATAAELNALDGITATVTELNYTDGVTSAIQTQIDGKAATAHTHALAAGATDVTASAAELNILDGATLTTTELNYVDGVTSAIQGQIDGKQTSNTVLTELTALTDPGADRVAFWDESADNFAFLTMGTNLSITGTTLNASGGGTSDQPIVWIAASDSTARQQAIADYVCDGTADQVQFQSAIDDQITAGEEPIIGVFEGNYYFSAAVVSDEPGIAFIGNGTLAGAIVIQPTANITCFDFSGTTLAQLHSGIHLEGFTIWGGGNVGRTSPLVKINYAERGLIKNVRFTGHYGRGLELIEAWDIWLENVMFDGVGGTDGTKPAVWIEGVTIGSDDANNIWFNQCRIEDIRDGAIHATNAHLLKANQLKIETHANYRGRTLVFDNCNDVDFQNFILTIEGGLAGGVAQGVDFISIEDDSNTVRLQGSIWAGSFAASDVRSFVHIDGTSGAVYHPMLSLAIRQGGGSGPTSIVKFTSTVNVYEEQSLQWDANGWATAKYAGTPTTYADLQTALSVAGDPNADRLVFWDDSAGKYEHLTLGTNLSITGTTINASGGGSALTVEEGGAVIDATVTTIDFDASDFNITEPTEDEVLVALNYGTGAGQPAEGNHTHAALYQPLDADLTTLAANITAAGHALVDDADAAAQRTTLGVGTAQSPQFAGIELGAATDTTITRSAAGVIAVEGVTVPLNSTSATHTAGTIELGAATDTTLSRSAAGILAVEGVAVPLQSITNTHTAQQIELGHASDTTVSRSAAGVIAVEGVTVPLNSTTNVHTAQQIELGHASDTTITRVSAGVVAVEGTNISLAGHTHSEYVANTLVDAKGDIITATADNTPARLAVGGNGTVLTADSAEATGVKWAAAPAAGAAGADTQVQFNDGGTTLGGDAGLTYNKTTDALTVAGALSVGNGAVISDTADPLVVSASTGRNMAKSHVVAGQQSGFAFYDSLDDTLPKYEFGKHTDNSFYLYDNARSGNAIVVDGSTGVIYLNWNSLAGVDTIVKGDTDANLITADASADSVGIGVAAPTARLHLKAGSATASTAPVKYTAGTVLTTPEAGAVEFDGVNWYMTQDTTSGRARVMAVQEYRLAANSATSSPAATIADFFPSTSSLSLAASSIYKFEAEIYFTKATAGTMLFTLLASSAPTAMTLGYQGPGMVITITNMGAATAATTVATGVTGSLSNGVNFHYILNGIIETNAACNIRLRATPSAGTFTPLRNSIYRVRRLGSTNPGAYV